MKIRILNESMKHKKYDIVNLKNTADRDRWDSKLDYDMANDYNYFVPGLNQYYNDIDQAKSDIDLTVAYNKSHSNMYRDDTALYWAIEWDKFTLGEEIAKYIDEHFPEYMSHNYRSRVKEWVFDVLADKAPVKQPSVKDIYDDIIDFYSIVVDIDEYYKNQLDALKRYLDSIKKRYERIAPTPKNKYSDGARDKYKWYVTHYTNGAVFEPAEGGYYVETTDADSYEGFNTYQAAVKRAKELAREYGLVKVNDNYYVDAIAHKYVGDGEFVCVEDENEFMSQAHDYDGYQ